MQGGNGDTDFPGGSMVKNLSAMRWYQRCKFDPGVGKNAPANAGDAGSIPGLERSPGERNGYLLKYSCLGNPMDTGAWRTTVHGFAKTQT